jgi:hypothetical protein
MWYQGAAGIPDGALRRVEGGPASDSLCQRRAKRLGASLAEGAWWGLQLLLRRIDALQQKAR